MEALDRPMASQPLKGQAGCSLRGGGGGGAGGGGGGGGGGKGGGWLGGAYSRAPGLSKSGRRPMDSSPLVVHTTLDGALSFSFDSRSSMSAIGPK